MAVTESDYLHIRTENASFLLLRNSTHFHLIRIDAGLSEAKMAKLLRIYPCEANRLRELGISFSAFKSTSLRGVTIKGYCNGDPIEFWLGSIVREYQLDADYSEEFIHNFFAGHFINNRLPPKWDGLERNLIRKITWSLNWFSCACSAAFLWLARPYWLWSVLCILCQIAALVVVLIYPSSFTLLENRKQKYLNAGKGHLLPAYSAPLFVLGLRTLRDFTFEGRAFLSLFLTSVAVSCGVTLLLYVFVFRKNPRIRHPIGEAVAMVILTVFLSFGMVGQLNYLLDFHYTTEHIAEVVSKDYEYSTKSTTYSCTAQLPNGQTIELSIDGRTYQAIQVGDDVLVTHHEGTFRIPFFTIQTFSQ